MFTIPNILTLVRLIAVPVFLIASFRGHYTLAFGLFVGAVATDFLDGMIARRFNQRSRLGAVLDPAADKTIMVCGYLFYTLRDGLPVVRIPAWLTFTVFIRDFLIIGFAYMLYTRVKVKRFPESRMRSGRQRSSQALEKPDPMPAARRRTARKRRCGWCPPETGQRDLLKDRQSAGRIPASRKHHRNGDRAKRQ